MPRQNYHELKQICFATKKLFEDPVFSPPADDGTVKWLRPVQFSLAPKFFADGVSRFDVNQGELGDCWLVAAMSNLTLNSKLFDRVVPSDQSFDAGAYCGLFRFNFWRFGKWVEVVIDDRLPISKDDRRPMFVRSSDIDEFWSPLLEKAYAKLYTSYEALDGGFFCEAMVDFTGGLSESYTLQTPAPPKNLWLIMKKGFERGSMMGCSIRRMGAEHMAVGLISGHQYSITNVVEVTIDTWDNVRLVRIRNPWGNDREWTGAWSDRSAKWYEISDSERERIGFTAKADGEFWMTFEDFKKYFHDMVMCNLGPESVESNCSHRWYPKQFEGSWSFSFSDGGHRTPYNSSEFVKNPQYFVKLTEPDRDDPEGNCTLVVALMQKDFRLAIGGCNGQHIGFYVYAVDRRCYEPPAHLPEMFFDKSDPLNLEPIYTYDREVISRFHLKPGTYVIVPTTHEPREEGQFMLRIWTEHLVKFCESTRRTKQDSKYRAQQVAMPSAPYDNVIKSSPMDIRAYSKQSGSKLPSKIKITHISSDGLTKTKTILITDNVSININNNNSSHQRVSTQVGPNVLYPSLPYPGKPRIVNRPRVNSSKGPRAMMNIRLTRAAPKVPQKKHRGFVRKIFGKLLGSNKPTPTPKQRR